jgi:hypothetical protein
MARKAMWILIIAAAASGCGGGGGGGNPTPPPPPTSTTPQRPPPPALNYTGRSVPAQINAGNANALITTPVFIPVTAGNLLTLFAVTIYPATFDGVIEHTQPGSNGGQVTLRGVLQLGSGPTSTGWLWLEFDSFADSGYILDGRVVQDVRAPMTPVAHSIRMEFTDLHLTERNVTHALNGTVESVRADDATGNRRTMTVNLTQRNVLTGEEVWAQNVVASYERATLFSFNQVYSGRVHHSVHGYVDVSSDSPLSFISNERVPDRGGPLRVRGANASAGLIALNTEYAAVVLDDDGDGVDDRFSRLGWPALLSGAPRGETHSPAVANAGAKRTIAVGETIELDGLLSHDKDASFLTVDWTLAVKPVGSTAGVDFAEPLTPSFTPDVPGYYMFALEVNDPDGDAYDSVIVQAVPFIPNPSPTWGVQMRMDRPAPAPLGTPVSLDASASRREDLSNWAPLDVLYSWTLGKPPGSDAALTDATSPTSSIIPDMPGFYRLRVENGVPGTAHRAETSKVVGFGTGFQYFESAHMASNFGVNGDPVVTDLDGDGSLDIAGLGTSPSGTGWVIHVMLGDGRGNVVLAAEFPVDHSVTQLLHGDLDGDGFHDLVTLGQETLYVAYLDDPIGSSTLRTIPLDRGAACGFGASLWAAMADRDADGRAELLVADRCRLEALTWRQPPGGVLSLERAQPIPELRGFPVVFGDLTNDGRADFVVPRVPPSPQDALLVFAQNASGDFSLRQALEGRGGSSAIGDVTGDGRSDLVVTREPVLSVFVQQPGGALASATDYTVGPLAPMPPRFADLDDDGRIDLVAVRQRDDLLIGLQQPQGPLAFVTLLDDLEQNSDSAAVPADWNGDGRVDLVRRRHVMNDVGFSVRLRMP